MQEKAFLPERVPRLPSLREPSMDEYMPPPGPPQIRNGQIGTPSNGYLATSASDALFGMQFDSDLLGDCFASMIPVDQQGPHISQNAGQGAQSI